MRTVLIGAGGHAKVVFEAMKAMGINSADIIVRADKDQDFMGAAVKTPEILSSMAGLQCHVAIGNNAVRHDLSDRIRASGGGLLRVVHPRAILSVSATVGDGTLVAAGACVAAMAHVGEGVIVNHGAIVDHDCAVGDMTHIAPGAVLGGAVSVGSLTLIGSNAVVLPGVQIGDNVIVGAGSVVTKTIPSGHVWIGAALLPKEQ